MYTNTFATDEFDPKSRLLLLSPGFIPADDVFDCGEGVSSEEGELMDE